MSANHNHAEEGGSHAGHDHTAGANAKSLTVALAFASWLQATARTADAEAVLTARAPGTITRIFSRIGDPVRAGQTLALVESRDASQIAADRSSASARVTLAQRQLARERTLLAQGVSPRADYEAAQKSAKDNAEAAARDAELIRAALQRDPMGYQQGTGAPGSVEGYQISGKTGTAQQVDPSCGCYSNSRYNITFAGIAPADNPERTTSRLDAKLARRRQERARNKKRREAELEADRRDFLENPAPF